MPGVPQEAGPGSLSPMIPSPATGFLTCAEYVSRSLKKRVYPKRNSFTIEGGQRPRVRQHELARVRGDFAFLAFERADLPHELVIPAEAAEPERFRAFVKVDALRELVQIRGMGTLADVVANDGIARRGGLRTEREQLQGDRIQTVRWNDVMRKLRRRDRERIARRVGPVDARVGIKTVPAGRGKIARSHLVGRDGGD